MHHPDEQEHSLTGCSLRAGVLNTLHVLNLGKGTVYLARGMLVIVRGKARLKPGNVSVRSRA